MKKVKKQAKQESSAVVISTMIAIIGLVALFLIYRGQRMAGYAVATRYVTLTLSVVLAISAISLFVVTFIKEKLYMIEYAIVALVSAAGFYMIHGVGFVPARYATYAMVAFYVVYFVAAFVVHTILEKRK